MNLLVILILLHNSCAQFVVTGCYHSVINVHLYIARSIQQYCAHVCHKNDTNKSTVTLDPY